jgi:dihydrofolate reductase
VIVAAAAGPHIVFVVAVAENGVIGQGNAIPWRIKSDMQHFKALTIGKPVVMGRKTFASLRRPLPGRTNIVITRDAAFQAAGAIVTTSLDHARDVALGDALRRSASEIAVIGGADIYAQWMDIADRLEVTEVHAAPEGDTRLQPIDPAAWEEAARVRHSATSDDSADFSYVTYRRRSRH